MKRARAGGAYPGALCSDRENTWLLYVGVCWECGKMRTRMVSCVVLYAIPSTRHSLVVRPPCSSHIFSLPFPSIKLTLSPIGHTTLHICHLASPVPHHNPLCNRRSRTPFQSTSASCAPSRTHQSVIPSTAESLASVFNSMFLSLLSLPPHPASAVLPKW